MFKKIKALFSGRVGTVVTDFDRQIEAMKDGHFWPLITWERYYLVKENRIKNEPVVCEDINKITYQELSEAIELLEAELAKKPF